MLEGLINWVFNVTDTNGIIITMLALGGLFAFFSFAIEKGGKAILNLIMFFVAIPCIIGMSLIKKEQRKKRLEELGEIRAFIKENPTRLQVVLFVIAISISIMIGIWAIWKFVLNPLIGINVISQNLNLSHYTNTSFV